MLQRVLPPGLELDPESPGARQALIDWYSPDDERLVRLNLVTSLDGRATGADGTSESLSTRTDRMILGVIRETSDAVLVGATTVRAESLARPRRTPLVVLTASGDLAGHGFTETTLTSGQQRAEVLVVTTSDGAPVVRRTLAGTPHEVLELDDHAGSLDLASVLAALRERGFHRVVAEGGPTLASRLLRAGLVDELCLTIVPRIVGRGIPVFDGQHTFSAAPRLLLVDGDGAHYGRWRLTPTT